MKKVNKKHTTKKNKNQKKLRSYVLTLAELLDRLSVLQLKEVRIPENRESYAQEIQEIMEDVDTLLLEEAPTIDAKFLRDLIILAHYNNHIWYNESEARKGNKENNNLYLTHSLNGVRRRAMNRIQESISGRKDLKTDCLAAEHSNWEPSW